MNPQRLPEITLENPAYPVRIAHGQGLVQMHFFLQVGNHCRVLVFPCQHDGRVPRQQLLQTKNNDGDEKHRRYQ